jgi:hypothetical protein
MAEDSADVMRKHLKEKLIPPDHINTALSAGVSEVIEIMMAKKKENRYNDVEELLTDLNALREGQTPLQAHKRFDVSILQQLENGDVVEKEEGIREEAVAQYRMAILILSTVVVLCIVIILILWFK